MMVKVIQEIQYELVFEFVADRGVTKIHRVIVSDVRKWFSKIVDGNSEYQRRNRNRLNITKPEAIVISSYYYISLLATPTIRGLTLGNITVVDL